MARFRVALFVALAALALAACRERSDDASVAISSKTDPATPKQSSAALAGVNDSLKSGAYDDAAARLLELQASGRSFTPAEAADYRKAMNEAYTRALEAAEKGDKRAEAAIQMIRAANPR